MDGSEVSVIWAKYFITVPTGASPFLLFPFFFVVWGSAGYSHSLDMFAFDSHCVCIVLVTWGGLLLLTAT